MVTRAQYDQLLPEAVRRRLEPLMLVATKVRAGAMKGERRSIKRGTSIEFADYRNYTPGDDLRKLDWNVYARLERPFIKLLEDEEDLAVHILLDVSASMNWPQDDDEAYNKLLFGRRLLAALAYISLTTGDRLMLAALASGVYRPYGPVRGRGQMVPMLRYAHDLQSGGVTDLNRALKDYALREKRAGLVFLISDLFAPEGYHDGIKALLAKGHEVVVLHLLSPDEITPPLAGDLRLLDIETGTAQEVTVDAVMRGIYEQRVRAWLDSIRDDFARRGVHYVMTPTNNPWEKTILYDLRRVGVVK